MTIWHSVILEERAVKPPEPSPHSFYEVSPADLSNYYRGVSTADWLRNGLGKQYCNWFPYGI